MARDVAREHRRSLCRADSRNERAITSIRADVATGPPNAVAAPWWIRCENDVWRVTSWRKCDSNCESRSDVRCAECLTCLVQSVPEIDKPLRIRIDARSRRDAQNSKFSFVFLGTAERLRIGNSIDSGISWITFQFLYGNWSAPFFGWTGEGGFLLSLIGTRLSLRLPSASCTVSPSFCNGRYGMCSKE